MPAIVWVVDGSSSNVFKVPPSGTSQGPFLNPAGGSFSLAFDGGNMWVSTTNASNNTYSHAKM